MENTNKGLKQVVKNFFTQAHTADEYRKFRHQSEMELAKKFGARFKNFTPDSCDMIFPTKEAMEAFEEARKEFAMEFANKPIRELFK